MHVALFVPCYMDAFEPEVGIATLELLERLGCTVEYPYDQTCCGQPMVKPNGPKRRRVDRLPGNWRRGAEPVAAGRS
jgi:heterodisulfide reductase subunit B